MAWSRAAFHNVATLSEDVSRRSLAMLNTMKCLGWRDAPGAPGLHPSYGLRTHPCHPTLALQKRRAGELLAKTVKHGGADSPGAMNHGSFPRSLPRAAGTLLLRIPRPFRPPFGDPRAAVNRVLDTVKRVFGVLECAGTYSKGMASTMNRPFFAPGQVPNTMECLTLGTIT